MSAEEQLFNTVLGIVTSAAAAKGEAFQEDTLIAACQCGPLLVRL